MSNVVNLSERRRKNQSSERSVIICNECGSGWWIVAAVCFEQDGRISGYAGIPQCRDCGAFHVVVDL